MTNQEKQADEILVLQSIFDKKFRPLGDNQYEISIEFELLTPITLQFNDQSSIIEYLPPFTLIIHYHDDYPSIEPPSFILSCFFFSKDHLQKLCQKFDHYPFQNEVCVYDWIDLIKQEINDPLILKIIDYSERENDPRALNGYSNETVEKVYQYLINYNQEYADKQFEKRFQTCLICTEILPGIDCVRLHRCGHFYCRICLNNYVQMTLNNGQFGEKIHCPQNQCQQPLLPTEIRQILQNDQLYERYERLTLQRSLELMNDITWCPRCQSAVLMENQTDNLAICYQCRYTFCSKCKEIFHSQTMCPKDYIIEQLRLQKEKERIRLEKQREEALAKITKFEKERKTLAERNAAKEKYRRIVISLSEQDELLEEVLNAERIESLNTQHCPQCHIRIEKNGGCSHMHCSQCDYDFTWRTIPISSSSTTTLLNDKTADFESVKEELSKEIDIVKLPQKEADETDDEDMKISIDNRSIVGSAIIKRVQRCPSSSCRKINVKGDLDNWIVCNECMRQFCFLCGNGIHGTGHFGKKCERYTPT